MRNNSETCDKILIGEFMTLSRTHVKLLCIYIHTIHHAEKLNVEMASG